MLRTLPAYYWGEPLIERIVQAWANEFDRVDALLDQIRGELNPGTTTDDLGLLTLWEKLLRLPAAPVGVSEADRRLRVLTVLRRQTASSGAEMLEVIDGARNGQPFTVQRDMPGPLRDRLEIPYTPGGQTIAELLRLVVPVWSAHRELLGRYTTGFLFDVSEFDLATF